MGSLSKGIGSHYAGPRRVLPGSALQSNFTSVNEIRTFIRPTLFSCQLKIRLASYFPCKNSCPICRSFLFYIHLGSVGSCTRTLKYDWIDLITGRLLNIYRRPLRFYPYTATEKKSKYKYLPYLSYLIISRSTSRLVTLILENPRDSGSGSVPAGCAVPEMAVSYLREEPIADWSRHSTYLSE